MIEYLNIIIDLILIWAVGVAVRQKPILHITKHVPHKLYPKLEGQLKQAQIRAAISEKFAERAFTMASTANLGVIALQKSLAVPKFITKAQSQRNQLAKNEIDKLFTTEGEFDYLRSILPQEEIEILDAMEREKIKKQLELSQSPKTNGVI